MYSKAKTIVSAGLGALALASLSSVSAQATEVSDLEAARTVQLQSASPVGGTPGEASWFKAFAGNVWNVATKASPVRWGVAAVTAANVGKKQETTARFAGVVNDAQWTAAAQSASDALLAPATPQ
jgi:hypothetical protein